MVCHFHYVAVHERSITSKVCGIIGMYDAKGRD